MTRGFQITEESPDRQYFTLLPNYIVNHSDIWEQGVYVVMKRFAGEKGTCFATHQTIAEQLKISRPTVSKTIKKLVDRGWIKEVGTRPGKTRPVREYQVVDLWKLNVDFYRKKIRKPQNVSSKSKKDMSTTEHKISKPRYTKKSNIEEDNNIKKIIKRKKSYSSLKDINNGVIEEIAEQYKVPVSYVQFQREALINYCESKGKRYKDYKAALRNFVLRDMRQTAERSKNVGSYGKKHQAIDASDL